MAPSVRDSAVPPVCGAYAFNLAGAPVVLHDGPIGHSEGAEEPAIVELRFTGKPRLS